MSEEPTWRYTFADGRRFTSCLQRDYAEAQAFAVAKVEKVPIVRVERWAAGRWIEVDEMDDAKPSPTEPERSDADV